ncbi:TetR family transcriptional regulator [Streptomyces sp. NPDC002740]
MTSFQRARSEEQREVRRRSILDVTAAMLEEMPVAEISLNELSRRVGLAKSNVLRYFDSREVILLELLDRAWKQWTADLPEVLDGAVDPQAPPVRRAEQFAVALAASLTGRTVFCDLLSAQAGVLEHNASPQAAAHYKRAALANVGVLAALADAHLPDLGERTFRLAASITMTIGAVWTHSRPSPAMLAAYEADPDLAAARMDFTASLQDVVATLAAGSIARATLAP